MAACLAIAPEMSLRSASLEPVRRIFAAVFKVAGFKNHLSATLELGLVELSPSDRWEELFSDQRNPALTVFCTAPNEMLRYDNITSGGCARTVLQFARRQARRLAIHAVTDRDLPIPHPSSLPKRLAMLICIHNEDLVRRVILNFRDCR